MAAFDHERLMSELMGIDERAGVSVLTRSIMGKEIPLITLGKGKRAVAMIACQRGDESKSSAVLLAFIKDYLAHLSRRAAVLEYSVERLFEERRIYLVPMLNPDGVDYALHGVSELNPLRDRLLEMNNGEDFSRWRANARGVDLARNYEVGFMEYRALNATLNGAPEGFCGEYPESEPETASLCRFLRFKKDELCGVLSLGTGGDELLCGCGETMTAKIMSAGRILSRMSGFRLVRPEQITPGAGLGEWCTVQLGKPAYSFKCGEAVSKKAHGSRLLYERVRNALFSFAYLV